MAEEKNMVPHHKATPSVISFPHAELTTTGIRITPGTTEQQLGEIARKITAIGTGYQWWVGGMVSYAQQNFKDPNDFIQSLQELTGWGRGYLQQLGKMHLLFPSRDRFTTLSFHHHMAVRHIASRAKRLAWLNKADNGRWPESRLRERVPSPSGHQNVRIILRVTKVLSKDTKFLRILKQLCKEFEIDYYIAGQLRHRKATTLRKPLLTTATAAK